MATLNARQNIRGAVDDTMTVSLSKIKQTGSAMVVSRVGVPRVFIPEKILTRYLQRPTKNISIKVDTVQEYSEDNNSDREVRNIQPTHCLITS
jgi:hypothetical protein